MTSSGQATTYCSSKREREREERVYFIGLKNYPLPSILCVYLNLSLGNNFIWVNVAIKAVLSRNDNKGGTLHNFSCPFPLFLLMHPQELRQQCHLKQKHFVSKRLPLEKQQALHMFWVTKVIQRVSWETEWWILLMFYINSSQKGVPRPANTWIRTSSGTQQPGLSLALQVTEATHP